MASSRSITILNFESKQSKCYHIDHDIFRDIIAFGYKYRDGNRDGKGKVNE